MKRYDGILLCSDYDNTLTDYTYRYHEGDDRFAAIPAANIAAIKEFVKNGGTFAMVSGRNPNEIEELNEIMPIGDLSVCCNGAAVYSFSQKRALVSYALDERCLDVIRHFARESGRYLFMRLTDNDFNFVFYRDGDDLEAVLRQPKLPAYKMIIEHWGMDERLALEHYLEAKEKFSQYFEVEMSGAKTVEICPKGSGKGEAIKRMLPLFPQKFERVICVGDNDNDISMMRCADVGYAVGNAIDALKEAADIVTVDSSQGAIAAVIEDL